MYVVRLCWKNKRKSWHLRWKKHMDYTSIVNFLGYLIGAPMLINFAVPMIWGQGVYSPAWHARIGARKMLPMFLEAAAAQRFGQSSRGWGVGSEVPTTQTREGREAVDLMQTARERRTDVLHISEQYKWSENSAWFQNASRSWGKA